MFAAESVARPTQQHWTRRCGNGVTVASAVDRLPNLPVLLLARRCRNLGDRCGEGCRREECQGHEAIRMMRQRQQR